MQEKSRVCVEISFYDYSGRVLRFCEGEAKFYK